MTSNISSRTLTVTFLFGALGLAVLLNVFNITPAASQDSKILSYLTTTPEEELVDPWSSAWSDVPAMKVVLSAQNATKPLGGAEVASVRARSLHDGRTLYVLLEWKDKTMDDTVNGQNVFADAAAIEFPSRAGVSIPSFCMGDANGTVNIWHWKAAAQRDINDGFVSVLDRYPDGHVDEYPFSLDPAFNPALTLGNSVAQRDRASPVENLIAGSFGTLTTAKLQDVQGTGVWKDGSWRVVFIRPLTTAADYPSMAAGDVTNIAFAVWDGSRGNRDGIKSVSQFLNLQIGTSEVSSPGGVSWQAWAIVGAIAAVFTGALLAAFARISGKGP